MNNLNEPKISFIIGEETFPKVERIEEVASSYFREVYLKAFSLIDVITGNFAENSNVKKYRNDESKNIKKERNVFFQQNEKKNNIITFIGERGSGKTSCMLTVRSILHQLNKEERQTIDKLEWIKDKENIKTTYFQTLEIIDPSYFESENNILEIIISKMFKEFKKYAQNPSYRLDCEDAQYVEKKRTLIRCFQEVKDSLDEMKKVRNHSNDSIEELSKMASSMELKEQIQNLVTGYLDYFGEKNDVLLIAVDDIDLQTDYAGLMIEQIRKYLISSNVIILMALKLNQLTDIIKQDYYRSYDILIKHEKSLSDSIADMAERYLTKILPYEHRLYLPELRFNMDIPLEIKDSSCVDNEVNSFGYKMPIKRFVLKLLYDKAKLLFYNQDTHPSFIIPTNLRGMLSLVSMLYNIPSRAYKQDADYNEYLVKQYFLESWCCENVQKKLQNLLLNLQNEAPAVINKRIVSYLVQSHEIAFVKNISLVQKEGGEIVRELDNKYYQVKEDNKYYNISLADVLWALERLGDYNPSIEIQKEIFAIKTFYSLILEEAYSNISKEQSSILRAFDGYFRIIKRADKNQQAEDNEQSAPLSFGNRYASYSRILNGNIIQSNMKNFCIGDRTTHTTIISGELLDLLYASIKEKIETYSPNELLDFNLNNVHFRLKLRDAINIWEFFIFNISDCNIYGVDYRAKATCYYDVLPYRLGKKPNFDVSAILPNLFKYYQYWSYVMLEQKDRDNLIPELYLLRKIVKSDYSLFYKIYKSDNNSIKSVINSDNAETMIENRTYDKKGQDGIVERTSIDLFLPHISNIEILEKLVDSLSFTFDEAKYQFELQMSDENLKERLTKVKVLEMFYDKLYQVRLQTYNYDGGDRTYTLDGFRRLYPIVVFLKDLSENTVEKREALRLFDAIYTLPK